MAIPENEPKNGPTKEKCLHKPFSFTIIARSVSIEELQAIVESSNILHECGSTPEAVCRCCLAFRESGRFEEPIS
jgi:hypothetical protein